MARTVSTRFRHAMNDPTTTDVIVALIEINYAPGLTLRLCDNNEIVVHNSLQYLPFPFTVQLPDDTEGTIPTAILHIDHVDQTVYQAITTTSPTGAFQTNVNIAACLAATPDVLDLPFQNFLLGPVEGDDATITATLISNLPLNEPFPGDYFTPTNFPKLFTKLAVLG